MKNRALIAAYLKRQGPDAQDANAKAKRNNPPIWYSRDGKRKYRGNHPGAGRIYDS